MTCEVIDVAAAQAPFAGLEFSLAGPVDAHHDQARFTRRLGRQRAAQVSHRPESTQLGDERPRGAKPAAARALYALAAWLSPDVSGLTDRVRRQPSTTTSHHHSAAR